MSSPRSRHLLGLAGAAACLVALTACGTSQPAAQVTSTGQGQAGEVTSTPTGSATTTASTPTTATTSTGGAGNPAPAYPTSAKDYGLAVLQAIAGGNDSKIVDLSSLNTANYIQAQNYKSKNGSWTWTDCSSGGAQSCSYYNQTGDFATVGVDATKLGKSGAVTSVSIEGNSFPADAVGYAQAFAQNWTFDGSMVKIAAYATPSVVTFANAHQKLNAGGGGVSAASTSCPPGNSGKTCVNVYAVGGSLTISYVLIVDPSKLGAPNAVVGAAVQA